MESEVLKTGMNLIMEKQIIPNPCLLYTSDAADD